MVWRLIFRRRLSDSLSFAQWVTNRRFAQWLRMVFMEEPVIYKRKSECKHTDIEIYPYVTLERENDVSRIK